MALGRALVDQARPLTKAQSAVKIRGESRFETLRGQWFRCRLTLPGPQESAPQYSRRRVVLVPSLLYGVKDADGELLRLGIEMRLEVNSRELGRTIWDVVSEPEPLRKRRRVIGWQASLRRVKDEELPDAEVA